MGGKEIIVTEKYQQKAKLRDLPPPPQTNLVQ